jgi:hypothetical protein
MTAFLFILAWLLCGFAGAYIGHRWADKGELNTTLDMVFWLSVFGPLSLIGATMMSIGSLVNTDKVVFKRKAK